MRLIIEARLAEGDNDTVEESDGVLAVVERPDCCLAELGLSRGRALAAGKGAGRATSDAMRLMARSPPVVNHEFVLVSDKGRRNSH